MSLLGGELSVTYIRGAEIHLLPYASSDIKYNVVDFKDMHAVRGEPGARDDHENLRT